MVPRGQRTFVSVSRPLMGFGKLNDNMIKGLTLYVRYHEQGFILYIIVCIVSCIKESNKRELIIENQACCDEKWETSIHAMTIYGFYSWLDIFEEYVRYKIVESIIARLHGVKQKEKTYTYMLHTGLIFWSLQCLEDSYQIMVTKQDKHIMKER